MLFKRFREGMTGLGKLLCPAHEAHTIGTTCGCECRALGTGWVVVLGLPVSSLVYPALSRPGCPSSSWPSSQQPWVPTARTQVAISSPLTGLLVMVLQPADRQLERQVMGPESSEEGRVPAHPGFPSCARPSVLSQVCAVSLVGGTVVGSFLLFHPRALPRAEVRSRSSR